MFGPHGDGSQGLLGGPQDFLGGFPSKPGRQKHLGLDSIILQPLLGPHEFLEHSSPSGMQSWNGFPVIPFGQ